MNTRRLLAASAIGLMTLGAAAPALADPGQPKVTICHGSAHHYVVITVDANAVAGHFDGTAPGHGHRNLPDVLFGLNGCDGGPGPTDPTLT